MNFRKIMAASTALLMLIPISASLPQKNAYAASLCTVDTSKTYQTIRGFGGINHPEWIGDLTDAQRQTAFGNGDNELGLTILRLFVNPDSSQWYRALPTAQYATQNDVTIFASPWEPPANLAESGGSNGKLHIPSSNYGAYAQHLNNFGIYMKDNGVDLYAISVQNEPDYASEWTYWSTDETTDFIANYGDQITSTRLMSPESFQYAPETASWVADGGKKFYTKILNNSKAMANCDLFGTHFYGTQRDWMDFPALENCGKEIWMTEVYVPNSDANSANNYPEAIQVSENIHNAMVVGNMSVYTWWYIRRSYGLMTEDGNISKRGYCMAQYSKYVRPGDVRIDATEQPADDVYISAYKGDDNQVTIVAINKGSEGYAQEFSVSSDASIVDVDRYRTSSYENLAETQNLEYTGNSFWAQLPAESVSTFVVTLGAEADENGYFFRDTFEGDVSNWDSKGSSTITLSGRTAFEGKESLLIQERDGAWNGAIKSLDTTVFVPGNSYSFSVNTMYFDGDDSEEFFLKLQYKDAEGTERYSQIASATAIKGRWVQLSNTSYTIPEGATDLTLLIETADSTDNFYIDDAIGAVEGTVIDGAGLTVRGDINDDGIFNIADLIMLQNYLIRSGSVTNWKAGDLYEDNILNTFDLISMKRELGK